MIVDPRIFHLDKEKEEWLDITNFNVWQVLRLISGGKSHIRVMADAFKGSNTTLEFTVNSLIKWGLLSENKSQDFPFKRTLTLTKRGVKMLSLLDEIGEMVKEIRKERTEGENR